MNEYGRGALEALSWVRRLLREERDLKRVKAEVEKVVEMILNGVAVDFRRRMGV